MTNIFSAKLNVILMRAQISHCPHKLLSESNKPQYWIALTTLRYYTNVGYNYKNDHKNKIK